MADSFRNSLPPTDEYDPTFVHSRREFVFIVCLWAGCLVWAVPYCYLHGYVGVGDYDPANAPTVWGIPRWVFFGIVVPWAFADVVTIGFCLFFMKDDDLGEVDEEAASHGDVGAAHNQVAKPQSVTDRKEGGK